MKRLSVCAALCLALCLAFTSCAAYKAKETTIYVITKGTDSDFWQSVRAGVSAAAVENDVTAIYEGPDSEEDYATQNRMIDEAVEAGANAIVFSAIDRYETKKHLEDAVRKGVKLILIDSGADTEMAESFIGTDNYAAGKMVCEAVLDGMGTEKPLKVGLVNYDENTENGSSREEGFRDRAADAANIEIVASVHVASDADIAKLAAVSMMREHPDINVIVGFNEWMTLGIGGAIVLTGTDISAGRCVGLTACIAASLLQVASYSNKMFPNLGVMPLWLVFLIVVAVGALVGLVNGFFVAKFKLHPFIVTLSTQLIVFGSVLMYLMIGTNNGQTLSGLDASYTEFVRGTLFTVGGVAVPKYVLYAVILTALMWVIWNKTTFGKNMFAVGSNEEAANVSGVNVFLTIVLVFVLAGAMYGVTGFIEGARIASCSANTGLNYECDAIAACVIGGVSFVGGTGKISGIVIGVLLLQIIFAGLNFLSVSANMLYIIKGLIILIACAIDMRKYLVKK